MRTITVAEFAKQGAPEGMEAFVSTAWGEMRVGYVRWAETNPWVVCPDENAGFGQSFMVCRDSTLNLHPRKEA
jgi:hypothetical protein